MAQDRLTEILQHIRAATELAEQEAKERKELQPMTAAFRAAAQLKDHTPASMREISGAFNSLTASLLDAGMQISPGNELSIRIRNAVNEALHTALQEKGPGA